MPPYKPPGVCPDTPNYFTLVAASSWYRIHSDGRLGEEPRSDAATSGFSGGRFDSRTGDYSYLYAGETLAAAVAETILRDQPFSSTGRRVVERSRLVGRSYSKLEIAASTSVMDLRGNENLSKIGQDSWLTTCDSNMYSLTREWCDAIRSWFPALSGIIWRARFADPKTAIVLFGPPAALALGSMATRLKTASTTSIASGPGLVRVKTALGRYGARLGP